MSHMVDLSPLWTAVFFAKNQTKVNTNKWLILWSLATTEVTNRHVRHEHAQALQGRGHEARGEEGVLHGGAVEPGCGQVADWS